MPSTPLLISAAAGPGEHDGPEGTGVFQSTGEHVAAEAELIILVSIDGGGNANAEELVAHGGVAEDGGQQGGEDQAANGVDLVLEAAEQSFSMQPQRSRAPP